MGVNSLDNFKHKRIIGGLTKLGIYSLVFWAVYLLFAKQAYEPTTIGSDFMPHYNRIMPIIRGDYYLPHSMYHYIVYYSFRFLLSAGLNVTMLDVMLWFQVFLVLSIVEVIFHILKYFIGKKYSETTLLLVAVSLIFIGTLYAPFILKNYYLGTWNPNIWHNPTTFIIKPISLICLAGIFLFMENKYCWNRILFSLVLSACFTLSVWAKPSFVIVVYPALLVFALIYYRNDIRLLLRTFLLLFPSLLLLGYQYLSTYFATISRTSDMKDQIVFTFWGVTKLYSNNIIASLLVAMAYPLSLLVLDFKNVIKNKLLVLCWLTTGVAYLQASFLAEKFKFDQAAFAFGYVLALFYLYIFSTMHLLDTMAAEKRGISTIKISVIAALFVLHLASGVAYYFDYLVTGRGL